MKWIFFDVGSALVDETEADDHRVREMLAGTDVPINNLSDLKSLF